MSAGSGRGLSERRWHYSFGRPAVSTEKHASALAWNASSRLAIFLAVFNAFDARRRRTAGTCQCGFGRRCCVRSTTAGARTGGSVRHNDAGRVGCVGLKKATTWRITPDARRHTDSGSSCPRVLPGHDPSWKCGSVLPPCPALLIVWRCYIAMRFIGRCTLCVDTPARGSRTRTGLSGRRYTPGSGETSCGSDTLASRLTASGGIWFRGVNPVNDASSLDDVPRLLVGLSDPWFCEVHPLLFPPFLLFYGLAAALTLWTSRSPSGLLTAVLLDCVVLFFFIMLLDHVGILGTSADVLFDLRLDPLQRLEPSGLGSSLSSWCSTAQSGPLGHGSPRANLVSALADVPARHWTWSFHNDTGYRWRLPSLRTHRWVGICSVPFSDGGLPSRTRWTL
jgi:hypothetical protein